MAALRAGETGTLRVGDVPVDQRPCPARGDAPLPRRLARHRARALRAVDRPGALRRRRERRLDLAFCSLPAPDGPFDALELLHRPLRACSSRPTARSRARDRRSLADLGDVALIGSEPLRERHRRRGASSASRGDQRRLRLPLRRQQARCRGSSPRELRRRPRAAARGAARATSASRSWRLDPPVPRRRIAVVWHRDRHRSPAARAFVEIAREVSAEVERELADPPRV